MTKLNKLLGLFLLAFVLLTKAGFVLADAAQDLSDGISNIFKWGIGVGVLLSACVIAFGGALWIAQFAKGSFRQSSIEWIKAGLVGLLITMTSWLIIYTINPDVFNFDIRKLFYQDISPGPGGGGFFQPEIQDYDEIPIGMLTENLLTRKVNCYDFDARGNPIAGQELEAKDRSKFWGPTYLKHDRVDCYVKLVEAIEKKSLMVENLSKEINKLLNKCSCQEFGHCSDCNGAWAGSATASWRTDAEQCKLLKPVTETDKTGGGACKGCCTYSQFGTNGQSTCPGGSQSSSLVSTRCLKPGGGQEPDLSCCDPNERNQIKGYVNRHGDHKADPLKVYANDRCDTGCNESSSGNYAEDYYGLDEFYTTQNIDQIKEKIEKTKDTEEYGQITYIDLDNCPTCIADCNYQCAASDADCQRRQQECIAEQKECIEEKRPKCLKEETPWGKLNLIEQLMYLNSKLTELKDQVSADLESLKTASAKLSSCPLAKSYIDLNQADEQNNATATLIRIFYGDADISNYCDGFNYANSSCYKSCSEMCPITDEDVENCYSSCQKCDINAENYNQCKIELDKCVNNCYNSPERKCEKWEGIGGNTTFKNCISTCKNNCQNTCPVRNLSCSEDAQACQNVCTHDSKCVLDNISSCVLNSSSIRSCIEDSNNSDDNVNMCIEGSYTCKAGSEQHSGYPDCLLNPTQEDKFSSSFLYKNPDKQRCYWPPSQSNREILRINCVTHNRPETAKCPIASACPDCKCDAFQNEELNFSVEKKLNPKELDPCKGETDPSNGGLNNLCEKLPEEVLKLDEYRITGAECIKPAYNDDPLTFYCKFDWWTEKEAKREEPIGKALGCSKADEVPVGVLVDDSVKWADDFVKRIEKVQKASQEIINIAEKIKKAGEPGSTNKYCQCTSKYESGNPICRACCKYISPTNSENITADKVAYCNFKPCSVNSCQQLINWLMQIMNAHTDIKTELVSTPSLIDPRSDVLKELTYSRKQINLCSGTQNIIGPAKARLFSCQRVYDDLLPSIIKSDQSIVIDKKEIFHSCYGDMTGKVFSKPIITNNWFCCTSEHAETAEEKYQKSQLRDDFSSGASGASF